MPTRCCVVGCHNRHSTCSSYHFYHFPRDLARRRSWLSFVGRRNYDCTPWEPGNGDCVCSQHFISGSKSNIPNNPDYVPSVPASVQLVDPGTCAKPSHSVARFERAQQRSRAVLLEQVRLERMEQELQSLCCRDMIMGHLQGMMLIVSMNW
ncbi:PREDICTED: THAP domain-containing protein 11-like [Amphimedon queenslandica]|uniref:THAP-type domain-containing protein n=1 Tax=Amphimedon queenslandica TaxID=400682 RepID=A0AAN0IK80_AMPQE|nr:PREDICTED: THAP domain-containing protein 11-like [Amphimedon queenslandica]|eukprot:XP_011402874.1 PREDICTED: THAP domain-containing protein 11-like [Amphimedon queenslandica]